MKDTLIKFFNDAEEHRTSTKVSFDIEMYADFWWQQNECKTDLQELEQYLRKEFHVLRCRANNMNVEGMVNGKYFEITFDYKKGIEHLSIDSERKINDVNYIDTIKKFEELIEK